MQYYTILRNMNTKTIILTTLACTVFILSLWNINAYDFTFDKLMNTSKINNWDDRSERIVPYLTTTNQNMSLSKSLNFNINDFLMTDLVEHPEEANKLSALLTSRRDVINEAQRVQKNIFQSLLGKYKHAILFDFAPFENKGDSAISVGEIILLRKLNIEVVFACAAFNCAAKINTARNISLKYSNKELVILFHGGGNVIAYAVADKMRAREISLFMDFHIVMFPQGISYLEPPSHIDFCKKLYASHKNLTFVWRDKHSYKFGKKLFPKVHSLLSPDMAYQIGNVPRYMIPTHDILWIQRTDKETPSYKSPAPPAGYRMHISDWRSWKTPAGTSQMENIFLMTANGMTFLQRGRIVITDRLHGHILSTILGIPHVYIDNKYRKISNYHRTWTASVENIVLANSSADAVVHAKRLLTKLDNDLPTIKGFYTKH